jgi:hypothetical protein
MGKGFFIHNPMAHWFREKNGSILMGYPDVTVMSGNSLAYTNGFGENENYLTEIIVATFMKEAMVRMRHPTGNIQH